MKECPSCGLEVEKSVNICTYCRYEFPQSGTSYKLPLVILLVLLLLYPTLKIVFNFW